MSTIEDVLKNSVEEWIPDFSILTYKYFTDVISTLPTENKDVYVDPNGVRYSISNRKLNIYYNKKFLWIYDKFKIPSNESPYEIDFSKIKITVGENTECIKFKGTQHPEIITNISEFVYNSNADMYVRTSS